ncbi:MAG: tetratricopeptide repeat protein, partial [Planctomycetota bacterium]
RQNARMSFHLSLILMLYLSATSYASDAAAENWEGFGKRVVYFWSDRPGPVPDWLQHRPQTEAACSRPDSHLAIGAAKALLERIFQDYQEDAFLCKGRMLLNQNPNCILGLYLAQRFAGTKLGNWANMLFRHTIERSVLVELGLKTPAAKRLQAELMRLDHGAEALVKFDSFHLSETPFLLIYLLENGTSQHIRLTCRKLLAKHLLQKHGLIPALRVYRSILHNRFPDAEILAMTAIEQRMRAAHNSKSVLARLGRLNDSLADLSHQLRASSPAAARSVLERLAVKVYDAVSVQAPFDIEIEPAKADLLRLFWRTKRLTVAKILSAEWDLARARLSPPEDCNLLRDLEPVIFAALLLQHDSLEEIVQRLGTVTDRQCTKGQLCRLAKFAQKVGRPYLARTALDAATQEIETIPDNVALLQDIANTYVQGSSHHKAIQIYQHIVQQVPDTNQAAKAQLATIDLYRGPLRQYDRAIDHCQTFLSKFPDSPRAGDIEFLVGKLAYLDKDYSDAIGHLDTFQTSHRHHPQVPEAMMLAALSCMSEGRTDRAIDRFTEIGQQYPRGEVAARSKFLIGYAQLSAQRYAQAIETFKQLVEQFPNSKHVSQAQSLVDRLSKLAP